MTGGPPYNIHSSPQQHRFAVYSPPNKSHPFYPATEQFHQPPPQTPPASFPPHPALARSPHFAPHAPSPLPTTLPPLNGSAPLSRPEPSTQFQSHPPGGPHQLPLPRPSYSAPILPGNGPGPYVHHASPSHTHPVGRLGDHLQSPSRDYGSSFGMRTSNGMGYSSQPPMMREYWPPSPPKETVSYF